MILYLAWCKRQSDVKVILCDRWIFSCVVFTRALYRLHSISEFGFEYFVKKY